MYLSSERDGRSVESEPDGGDIPGMAARARP
jgi:hypothetical protein